MYQLHIITSDKGGGKCDCPRCLVVLSVCLSVSKITQKRARAWIWMTFCMSTDVGTWKNWSTFEPDRDYSPDPGTRLLSSIRMRCNAEFYYVRKIPRIGIGRPSLQRGVVSNGLFTASHENTFVGGTCALPSALLVRYGTIIIFAL